MTVCQFRFFALQRAALEPEGGGKEDAGQIGASLVQLGEALDHGISAERLGDGISGDISEYWERLFDAEAGYPKEEIQNEFEVVDLDLLIIDYVAICPKFRGLGIAESAIHRTIDIFGTGCGLVACKPWPLQFTPSVVDEALKRLAPPNVGKAEALRGTAPQFPAPGLCSPPETLNRQVQITIC